MSAGASGSQFDPDALHLVKLSIGANGSDASRAALHPPMIQSFGWVVPKTMKS